VVAELPLSEKARRVARPVAPAVAPLVTAPQERFDQATSASRARAPAVELKERAVAQEEAVGQEVAAKAPEWRGARAACPILFPVVGQQALAAGALRNAQLPPGAAARVGPAHG
jgi:hypothetical protein